jgi:hypothetical protein
LASIAALTWSSVSSVHASGSAGARADSEWLPPRDLIWSELGKRAKAARSVAALRLDDMEWAPLRRPQRIAAITVRRAN